MPAPLPYKQLPAGQDINPRDAVISGFEQERTDSHNLFNQGVQYLQRQTLTDEDYEQRYYALKQKYDAEQMRLQQKATEKITSMNMLLRLQEQGVLQQDSANHALWRIAGVTVPRAAKDMDFRLEHQRNLSAQNRILNQLEMFKEKRGRLRFSEDPEKGRWRNPTTEEVTYYNMLLDAYDQLAVEEREILTGLSEAERLGTELQGTMRRRIAGTPIIERPSLSEVHYGHWGAGYMPKEKPVQARPTTKNLTKEIAKQYLQKYGSREAAMAAAARDGYI